MTRDFNPVETLILQWPWRTRLTYLGMFNHW